jgi:hypothetical protein
MRMCWSLGLLLLAACPGEAPPPPTPDSGEAPIQSQRVSGKAMDYFASTPLQGAELTSDGVDPELRSTSGADGGFAFEEVPIGSQVFFSATRTSYRPTRNTAVTIAGDAVTQDLYLMSSADIGRRYATAQKTPTPGRAFVVAELQRESGAPLTGVPLADVKLLDGAGAALPGLIGPYLLNDAGDIVLAATQTDAFAGKVRVAFLDVPPGALSLEVAYLDGQPQTLTASVKVAADGATIIRAGGAIGGPGGNAANPRFAQNVYPRLQTAANGGLGCANCHTIGGIAAIAPFNVLASDVLAALKAKPGMIDAATPANSALLKKPLYEATGPQDHPNATFVDGNDPNYKLFLLWIQQGAQP